MFDGAKYRSIQGHKNRRHNLQPQTPQLQIMEWIPGKVYSSVAVHHWAGCRENDLYGKDQHWSGLGLDKT